MEPLVEKLHLLHRFDLSLVLEELPWVAGIAVAAGTQVEQVVVAVPGIVATVESAGASPEVALHEASWVAVLSLAAVLVGAVPSVSPPGFQFPFSALELPNSLDPRKVLFR